MRAAALLCLLLAAAPFTPVGLAEDDSPTTFRLRFLVARHGGASVRPRGWLDRQVRRANELFAPAGVAFVEDGVEPLPEAHTTLLSRLDRHLLAPLVEDERIHAFVVQALANVDVEGDFIRGVHWRSRRGGTYRHYVILSRIAGEYVLAHELGHFFGNPHSPTPGNIMSYEDAPGPPFFDEAQLRRIRRHRQRFLESGELVPVADDAPSGS